MQLKITLILFLSSIHFVLFAQDQITAESYQQAESQLSFNTSKYVDRMNVRANWESDEQFWYRVLIEDGMEYVYYDIKKKKKTTFESRVELNKMLKEKAEAPQYNRRKEILSPDQSKVVFIKDWNLWIRYLESGEEKQLTTDGIENYGYATDNAGWRQSERPVVLWSPDSKKIATFQQDQRHVSDMTLVVTRCISRSAACI